MRARLAIILCLSLASAGELQAGDGLEALLRARRPDVTRWEIHPLAGANSEPASEVVSVGKLGPRTPVRLADERVRWYAVAGFSEVQVSAVALEVGDLVEPAHTLLAERDVIGAGCPSMPVAISTRWRATRRLAAGEVLCTSDLEPVPEIQRDQPVTITAHRGAVSVSRQLVASSDGRSGEAVRLRDRATGEIVRAIVTGPGEARVAQELR